MAKQCFVDHVDPQLAIKNIAYSNAPQNIVREVTVHLMSCIVHSYMYSFLLCCSLCTYLYIIPGPTQLSLLPLATNWGPKRSPFMLPRVAFYRLDQWPRTRARDIPFGPRVHSV